MDFEARLNSLKHRRQGVGREALSYKSESSQYNDATVSLEAYETLNESKAIKYALGAMAAVDKKSTALSISEGERVADSLISQLKTIGINTERKIQGSVALDIHIKHHSDVDMLILSEGSGTIDTPIQNPNFTLLTEKSMVNVVGEIRKHSEDKLKSTYWAADVDCSGDKSISLSGGSLQRKVDIVPACWHYSQAFQKSGYVHDAGVNIYNKSQHELIMNQPFLHIKRIEDKNTGYLGNLKSVIRLIKNVRADMPEARRKITSCLSSFDIASIGYRMDSWLECHPSFKLGLVANLKEYLTYLCEPETHIQNMQVPDGSRFIFDHPDKIKALFALKIEVDELAKAIVDSIEPHRILPYEGSILKNKYVEI